MYRGFFCLLMLLGGYSIPLEAQNQQPMQDVVYLVNGSVIRGTILEQDESVRIQTRDGSVFVYRMEEVERITREPTLLSPERKSPGTALALAVGPGLFSVQGIGQWYNGEIGKGFLFFVAGLVGLSMAFSDDGGNTGSGILGAILWGGSLTWSSIDAYRSAERINREGANASSSLSILPGQDGGLSLGLKYRF